VLRAIIVKTATAAAVLFAVSVIVFFGTEALPGDAAEAALGQTATPQLLEQYRKDFGLDRPVVERYREWASGLLHGDLGRSLPSGDPVSSVISDRIANTAILSLIVLLLLIPLSMLLGTLSALRRDSAFDHVVTTSTLSIIALPEFVVGAFLIVIFATWTGLLPPVSLVDPSVGLLAQPSVLILPVLTLLAAILGQTTRMVRACMIDVLGSDYVEMSRLKGVPERKVLLRHALPNAMGPTIQVLVLNVAWLAGGVVIAELVVFASRSFGVPPDDPRISTFFLAASIGSLLGTVILPALRRRWPVLTITYGLLAGSAVGGLLLAAAPRLAVAVLACGLWNATYSMTITNGITLRMQVLPDRYQSRVGSTARLLALSGAPVGALLAGTLAEHLDIRLVMGTAVVPIVAGFVLAAVFRRSLAERLFGPPLPSDKETP